MSARNIEGKLSQLRPVRANVTAALLAMGIGLHGSLSAQAEQAPQDSNAIIVKSYLTQCLPAGAQYGYCVQLRKEALRILADDIAALGATADPSYLPLLGKILQRDEPVLRAAAADAMGMIQPTPRESTLLTSALNDTFPIVRQASLRALATSADPNVQLLTQRAQQVSGPRGAMTGPESAPDAALLGVPVYAGASFLHFASDLRNGQAAFSTPDSVSSVMKFYAPQSKSGVLTEEQMAQMFGGEPPDDSAAQMQMAQEMSALMMQAQREGKSSQEIQALVTKSAMESASDLDISQYANDELFGLPRFIVLQESNLGGVKKAARFVVIFKDLALQKTGFVLHVPRSMPALPGAPASAPVPSTPTSPQPR